ncbi:MAG: radical SAM protein [Candidatus Lokiarchaeota archaeon]|nr:radical SAM protein [Candidatus Lokiarchaeota archaeon]
MIDADRLRAAYDSDGFYALQLEVGDKCEQGCIYCYMNALPVVKNSLSDELISGILSDARALGIAAIEWLGGEPLLRGTIFEHMARAGALGLRNNLWTGGLPLRDPDVAGKCVEACKNGLISVHVSSVDPRMYKALHPAAGEHDLEDILAGVERVLALGYPASRMLNSVTFTGLQPAGDMVDTIDYFERELGIATSLNVYHTYLRPGTDPGDLARFVPAPPEVARVFERMAEQDGHGAIPMNCVSKQYCSATLAVLCDGSVTPCATIREPGAPNVHVDGSLFTIANAHRDHLIIKELKDPANLPGSCRACEMGGTCWGCRSRAFAAGRGLLGKDPRCFRHQ